MTAIGLDIGTTSLCAARWTPRPRGAARPHRGQRLLSPQRGSGGTDPGSRPYSRESAGAGGRPSRRLRPGRLHRRHRADARHPVPGRDGRGRQPALYLAGRQRGTPPPGRGAASRRSCPASRGIPWPPASGEPPIMYTPVAATCRPVRLPSAPYTITPP